MYKLLCKPIINNLTYQHQSQLKSLKCKLFIFIFCLFYNIFAVAETLNNDYATSVVVTPDGKTIYTGGATSGNLVNNSFQGGIDAWIASYDKQGTRNWIRHIGGENSEAVTAMALDKEGNLLVTGYRLGDDSTVDTWIAKYDEQGNEIWLNFLSSAFKASVLISPTGIALDRKSNIIISGYNITLTGNSNGWLLKINTKGETQWLESIDLSGSEYAADVTVSHGDIFITGSSDASIGTTPNSGTKDVWIAHYDSNGTQQWIKQLDSDLTDFVVDISPDHLGGFYLTGYTFGALRTLSLQKNHSQDVWIARYDHNGNLLWIKQFGGSNTDSATAMTVDNHGNVYITGLALGNQYANTESDEDMWVAKLDSHGKPIWSRVLPLLRQVQPYAIDIDLSGELLVSGTVLTTAGEDNNAFLIKLSPSGSLIWSDIINSTDTLDSLCTETLSDASADTSLAEDARLTLYTVKPSTTDAHISSTWNKSHYIYLDKQQSPNQDLFLFLGGSYSKPKYYQYILQEAAKRGYYAIGLTYPNKWTVSHLCGQIYTEDCFWELRQEIISGTDLTDVIDISATESITNRLVKLLTYLDTQYPDQNWQQWLDNGNPDWPDIIVAGHSQGGGHAAVIGKLNTVDRVLMFAAPEDTLQDGTPASWFTRTGLTPSNLYFGFDHINDPFWAHNAANWILLGLDELGDIIDVDTASSFTSSRRFQTNLTPSTGVSEGRDAHGAVVSDPLTPLSSDNFPVYSTTDDIWDFMLEGK